MRTGKTILMTAAVLILAAPAVADWQEGDDHKMHYPQLPHPYGWDVAFNLARLADDWRCSETGAVSDVHFWVSWQKNDVQPIGGFSIRIHSDVPDPDGPGPLYSMPALDYLFERDFGPDEFTVKHMIGDPQGWFDPWTGLSAQNDHVRYAQINVENIEKPFTQDIGKVYWLEIDGWGLPNAGWKESGSLHYRDDGVAIFSTGPVELRDPLDNQSLDLAFVITPEPGTLVLIASGAVALVARRRRRR